MTPLNVDLKLVTKPTKLLEKIKFSKATGFYTKIKVLGTSALALFISMLCTCSLEKL